MLGDAFLSRFEALEKRRGKRSRAVGTFPASHYVHNLSFNQKYKCYLLPALLWCLQCTDNHQNPQSLGQRSLGCGEKLEEKTQPTLRTTIIPPPHPKTSKKIPKISPGTQKITRTQWLFAHLFTKSSALSDTAKETPGAEQLGWLDARLCSLRNE